MKASLMPYAARALSSPLVRQVQQQLRARQARAQGLERTLDVFISPRDPHAYLLLQVLPSLEQRFGMTCRYHVVATLQESMFPEPDLWQSWAMADARELAKLYRLEFPEAMAPPSESAIEAAACRMVQLETDPDFARNALAILDSLWHPKTEPMVPRDTQTEAARERIRSHEAKLRDAGHYLGALVHYEGQWYWGLDRLDHLERRLIQKGFGAHANEAARFVRTWADLCRKPQPAAPLKTTLDVYFSMRSPYSYLGLERAKQLADYYGCPLHVRPVLPMVMRGQSVPNAKKWYIFHDTKREAEKLGIPYGFVADPVGAGVERCYALFPYAREMGHATSWMLNCARAVNARGIRAETDRGLRRIVEETGLNWNEARNYLANEDWREEIEHNRQELYRLGLWGVPSFRFAETTAWGQDRLWLIQEAMRDAATDANSA